MMQTSAIKMSRLESRVKKAVQKCKTQGLTMTADFLQTKARRSFKTALVFSTALFHLNEYTKSAYRMDLEYIAPAKYISTCISDDIWWSTSILCWFYILILFTYQISIGEINYYN